MIDLSKHKLELTYPCEWEYRVVGKCENEISYAVQTVFERREYNLQLSNTSSKGKFKSFCIKTLVHNDDDRNELYAMLKEHEAIKYIL